MKAPITEVVTAPRSSNGKIANTTSICPAVETITILAAFVGHNSVHLNDKIVP